MCRVEVMTEGILEKKITLAATGAQHVAMSVITLTGYQVVLVSVSDAMQR